MNKIDVEQLFRIMRENKGNPNKEQFTGTLSCGCKSQEEHEMKTRLVKNALKDPTSGIGITKSILKQVRAKSSPEAQGEIDDLLFFGDIIQAMGEYNKTPDDLTVQMFEALLGTIALENGLTEKQAEDLRFKITHLSNKIKASIETPIINMQYSFDEKIAALLETTISLSKEIRIAEEKSKAQPVVLTNEDKAKSDNVQRLIKELTDLLVK